VPAQTSSTSAAVIGRPAAIIATRRSNAGLGMGGGGAVVFRAGRLLEWFG
jgi:hypothetical protein